MSELVEDVDNLIVANEAEWVFKNPPSWVKDYTKLPKYCCRRGGCLMTYTAQHRLRICLLNCGTIIVNLNVRFK